MQLVDTHCHIQFPHFDEDREAVLGRALDALAWLVVVGSDLVSSRAAIAMTGDRIHACVGVHPSEDKVEESAIIPGLEALLDEAGVVAIGETGLDYHYDFVPRDVQRQRYVAHLELAAKAQLPVVIHCREAHEDVAGIIKPYLGSLAGGIMHCFGGDADFARQCLDWGFYVSFAGNVTFPKAADLREAAAAVPLDRMLVETDAPYLAPQAFRGKRCEPVHVKTTAAFLAQLKDIPFDDFIQATSANASKAFRLA